MPSLEYRSLRGDLIETFKICNSIYDPKTTNNNLFKFVPNDNPTRTNGLKMIKNRSNSKQFQYFFTNRVTNLWNNLPFEVANASSLNLFKNKIDKIFNNYIYSVNIDVLFPAC